MQNVDESHNEAKEARNKWVQTVWFYAYKSQKQSKVIYVINGYDNGYFGVYSD